MTGLFPPHEIEQRFYGSKRSCRLLRTRELDRFKAAGVALVDLGLPDMILGASVVYRDDSSFVFADELDRPEEVSPAFVILCRDDEGDAIDIVAWSPSSGRIATWLGRAWAIDEFRMLQPRPSDHDALLASKTRLNGFGTAARGSSSSTPFRRSGGSSASPFSLTTFHMAKRCVAR